MQRTPRPLATALAVVALVATVVYLLNLTGPLAIRAFTKPMPVLCVHRVAGLDSEKPGWPGQFGIAWSTWRQPLASDAR